jgi:hypothetical protein
MTDELTSANAKRVSYDRLSSAGSTLTGDYRFIGRCKKCEKTHKLEGQFFLAHGKGPGVVSDQPWSRHDYVIRDSYGLLWTTAGHGSDTATVWVPCGDHRCLLRRVMEGKKASKHTCGARCTNATGPNCDCRCKGANHGSNC